MTWCHKMHFYKTVFDEFLCSTVTSTYYIRKILGNESTNKTILCNIVTLCVTEFCKLKYKIDSWLETDIDDFD